MAAIEGLAELKAKIAAMRPKDQGATRSAPCPRCFSLVELPKSFEHGDHDCPSCGEQLAWDDRKLMRLVHKDTGIDMIDEHGAPVVIKDGDPAAPARFAPLVERGEAEWVEHPRGWRIEVRPRGQVIWKDAHGREVHRRELPNGVEFSVAGFRRTFARAPSDAQLHEQFDNHWPDGTEPVMPPGPEDTAERIARLERDLAELRSR